MHLSVKAQVIMLILIVILIGSATVLRYFPAGGISKSSSNLASDPNQIYNPMELTDNNVTSALNNSTFFILDFYYPGCGPCKFVNNVTSELSSELQGQARFGRINVRENSQTVKKYKISSYPTLLFFDEGILVNRIKGNISKSDLLAAIKDLRPGLDVSKVKIVKAATSPKTSPKPRLTLEQACANTTKSDQPLLQAFVVSKCPFGLHMQRIMANIIGESIDTEKYLKVRYIGSVDMENNTIKSMHGEEEAQENLRQICIREEQSGKYWDYVRCYMREGNSSDCQKSVSLDVNKLDSCTNDSSRGLVYAQKDFDLAKKFKITGSPTILMNDKIVKESDFATNTTNSRSSEAVKELLCCGFNREPSFCSLELNESHMATMFSAK